MLTIFSNRKKSQQRHPIDCQIKLWVIIVCGLQWSEAHATTDGYCIDDWACVEKVEAERTVTYWLVNKKPYVITTTLEVSTSNLTQVNSNQTQFTLHQVLRGLERRKVLQLHPIHENKSIWYDESFYWTPGDMAAEHASDTSYFYPYAQGQYFRIVQGFGGGYSHTGASRFAIDFAMPVGTPIHAARAGIVIDIEQENHIGGASRKFAKYANYIVVLHKDGTTGEYYHLRKDGVVVSRGEAVNAGQKIGYSGNTGFSSLPHLHFAVYRAKPFGKFESLPFDFSQS